MGKCYIFTEEELTTLADTIRIKASISDKMTMTDMCEAIRNMDSGSAEVAKYGVTDTYDFNELTSTGSIARNCQMFKKYVGVYITTLSPNAFNASFIEEFNFPLLTSIGGSAFQDCSFLRVLTIQASVTSIGASVFKGCSSLGIVKFLNTLTSLPNYLFQNCNNLSSVDLPSGLTTIGQYAFSGCSKLDFDELPSTLTKIDSYGFGTCKELSLSELPDSITYIGQYAFTGCNKLQLDGLPANLATLQGYAFQDCPKVTIHQMNNDNWTTLPNYVFYKCTGITHFTLPSALTAIPQYGFAYCSSLSEIEFPIACVTINTYGFGYSGLKKLTIPSTITSIASYAFAYCDQLEEVVINPTMTSMTNSYIFRSCTALKKVYIKTTFTSLASNTFTSDTAITDIYVPWAEGAVANAPWGATNATVHYQTDFNQNLTSISVDNGEISRKSGKTYKINVTYSPDKNLINPAQLGVTYAITSGSEYATVDQNGLVTLTQTVLPSTTITVNVTSTYDSSITVTATITAINQSYSVDLNNQWVSAGSISSNPLYKSNNYHLASSVAKMYVTIKAYDRFAIAIRANSESSDKAYIGKLDVVDANADNSKCVLVEYGSSGSDYEMYIFEGLNDEQHRIEIGYVKDGSTDRYDDRAYVYFPSTNILTSISLTGDSISNGKSGSIHQLTVEYNPSYCDPELKGVTYSVTTNNATVDQNGLVTLTQDLTAGDVITVRATSTYNSSIYSDHSINVISLSDAKICMFLDDDCIYSQTSTHIDYNGNYEYQPNTVMAKYGASDTTDADIDSIGEGDYLMFTSPSWRRPEPMPSSFTMSDIINNWGLDGGGVVHDSPAWGCYVGNLGLVYGVQGISTVGTYPDTGEDYCVYIDEPMGSVLHLFTRSGEAEYANDFFIAAVIQLT